MRCKGLLLLVKCFTLLLPLPLTLQAQNQKFEYRVVIIDAETESPLEYVTVSLLDVADSILVTGITNDRGLFLSGILTPASKIRISCMGYATIEQTIESRETVNDMGTFLLQSKETPLEGAIVTGKTVQRNIDKTVYTVTRRMREPVGNAIQLAGQLPGVRFDRITDDVKVDNQSSVLLLVNDVQRDKAYTGSLSPDRIESIEVIKNPTGRFVSDDYYAVINFILKKDDAGYEMRLDNFTILDPAGNNGSDWLVNEQPKINFNLFNKQVDANLNFVTARIRWNYPISLKQDYIGIYSLESDAVTGKNPNQNYIYSGSGVNAGVQYQIAPGHSFFAGGRYGYEKTDENTTYQMLRRFSDIGFTDQFIDKHLDNNKVYNYNGSIAYIGQVSPKWHMKADFAYDGNRSTQRNTYVHNHEGTQSHYNISRDYWKFGIDGTYKMSPKFNLNLGQANTVRNYLSRAMTENSIWKSDEYRSRLYAYLSYRASDQLNIRLGGAWQYQNMGDDVQKQNQNSFQPSLRINYSPNDYLNINGRYSVSSTFPSLYELGNIPIQLDELMIKVGNPQLKPEITHQASLDITLFDGLTVTPMYIFSPTTILPVYEQRASYYYRTWQNMQTQNLAMIFNLNTSLGDYFDIDASLAYHYQNLKYQGLKNSYHTWLGNVTMEFYHPKLMMGADLEYDRSMDKVAMIQGYGMTEMDTWMLTVNKQFWNKRGQLMVSYVMPILWGRRTSQMNAVETPFYTQNESFGLKTYDNMLFIRFSVRFGKGKNATKKIESTTIEPDQKANRNLK